MIEEELKKKLESATFKRLVSHLQKNTDLQNIDLMNLAGFCRNCLSKWMVEEAEKMNVSLDYEEVRSDIYGMHYSEWKKISKTNQVNECSLNWCSRFYWFSHRFSFAKKKKFRLWY